jgi:deoxyribodipyrimidine photo-lyase
MQKPDQKVCIMWFRRDLRLHDNAAFYHALKSGLPVVPVFIFDTEILNDLEEKRDRRVEFIHDAITEMQNALIKLGSTMHVFYDKPIAAFKQLVEVYKIQSVFTNHDYEQYAMDRDDEIEQFLKTKNSSFHHYKDQVIFDKNEVIKDDGTCYTVFTPYSRKWKATLTDFHLKSYPIKKYLKNVLKQSAMTIPSLAEMGFERTGETFPSPEMRKDIIKTYNKTRDIPSIEGTSRLSIHLRFGTISIRELARQAMELNETYLNELIWRDFYHMILFHFPHVRKGESFRRDFDRIQWRNNEKEFAAWCEGKTGYPIVDAGMRELNATGFMHNRVRMVVASFLCKHLLIDWRWGEAYFAKKLLDYDYAANNGGWQWAAGTGCDASPYFRVFNPYLQTKKFDPELKYIKYWIPELDSFEYPQPIVEHSFARERALKVYGTAVRK